MISTFQWDAMREEIFLAKAKKIIKKRVCATTYRKKRGDLFAKMCCWLKKLSQRGIF